MTRKAIAYVLLAFPGALHALLYPLQTADIRQAYFLGRTTDAGKIAGFFEMYTRHFPVPAKGPNVAEVGLETPYELAVRRSWEHPMNYTEQDAERDFFAQPQLARVNIRIYQTFTYPRLLTPDVDKDARDLGRAGVSWAGFRFHISEAGRAIIPKKFSSRPLHHRNTGLGGAEVTLDFDASQLSPAVAEIEVTTPDGQHVEAKFDLSKLK